MFLQILGTSWCCKRTQMLMKRNVTFKCVVSSVKTHPQMRKQACGVRNRLTNSLQTRKWSCSLVFSSILIHRSLMLSDYIQTHCVRMFSTEGVKGAFVPVCYVEPNANESCSEHLKSSTPFQHSFERHHLSFSLSVSRLKLKTIESRIVDFAKLRIKF